jgi:hypothetical protein
VAQVVKIIHRDLKPANIKVTPDGTVKVLDFGLAKAITGDAGPDLSQLPTMTQDGTRQGIILGTPTYMSPEQTRGQPVDKRTDIWAFGCVLYELLTGRGAFPGATVSDTIAAILHREPDWTAVPTGTPPNVTRLLRRCLEKDQKRRLRDIGDAWVEIDDVLGAAASLDQRGPATPADGSRPTRTLFPRFAAAAATLAAVILAVLYVRNPRSEPALPRAVMRQTLSVPGPDSLTPWSPMPCRPTDYGWCIEPMAALPVSTSGRGRHDKGPGAGQQFR